MVRSFLISQCVISVMSNVNIGEYGSKKLQNLILDVEPGLVGGRGEHRQ